MGVVNTSEGCEASGLVWQLRARLLPVRHMTFVASSAAGSQTGWDGAGEANVTVQTQEDAAHGVVWLHEKGLYRGAAMPPVPFHNTFRLEFGEQHVGFSHERFGRDNAVWLFDVVATPSGQLVSSEPHQCVHDRYTVAIALQPDAVEMWWIVEGPKKNERIHYRYFE